ncbi:hypothetical protein F442_13684 [Phytophthora nicotianae P10297]|uniref:Uncharacterized protein n=2 Tax=Phytophthora nicotianae TaxID=4792 RepID=W2YVP9_PHYNI|nr:hypothetical protein L914_13292 [Phytophthora nicotianae]ETP38801.1 hypothetical protein F442_13684 [Phytophthora nicotianae P10297]
MFGAMAGVMGYLPWPEICTASRQRPCTSVSISTLTNGSVRCHVRGFNLELRAAFVSSPCSTAVPQLVDTTPDTALALGTVILVVF